MSLLYLASGMKSHNCIYMDIPYFLFENIYIIIITIIIIIIIIFLVRCLSLILYYTIIIFHCKFPLDFFSICIITPVYFFDILCLLIPLSTLSVQFFCLVLLFHFQELISNNKHVHIQHLTSSQCQWYKMAIKNL